MKILVIGSGGREHAICTAMAHSSRVSKLFCARGNAGIAEIAECIPIDADNVDGLAAFAASAGIDLTFVGGETSLALGVVDAFQSSGLTIVGPRAAAARLEASKVFAKEFMRRHNVPTARFDSAASPADAVRLLNSGTFGDSDSPVVVKADGLAAGKGVIVAANRGEALLAIEQLPALVGAQAATGIVIEECVVGREVSLLMFADGQDYALMPATRDHKRLGDGDVGPNTGGMGTVTDDSLLSDEDLEIIRKTIIEPTLRGCVSEGFAFRGVLFLGLMMTVDGPRLLEYNVRFGDPETQAILRRLDADLLDISEAIVTGRLSEMRVRWRTGCSACVVLAASGYPGQPRIGDPIHGLEFAGSDPDIAVFHAATARMPDGQLTTNGGRVLGVTATAASSDAALSRIYAAVEKISFDGMHYRRDIGR